MLRTFMIVLIFASLAAAQEDSRSLDDWLAMILPKASEGEWQKIPWRAEFGAAVVEAQEKKLPLLIWVMNGHPLGCT